MKKWILLLSICSTNTFAMTLEEYMDTVSKKNRLINSYQTSAEASQEKRVAGDLLLSPTLTVGYSVLSDKSEPSSVADKRNTTVTNFGVSKKFSTGTLLSLTALTTKLDYELPVTPGNTGYSTGGLGLVLQQSLWKDFFGVATRMRRERESLTNQLEMLGYELQRRVALIQAETDFWDYMVALEDLKLKQANFDRAKKLDQWTSNRVSNGISDQTDLLQVRALANLRELELVTSAQVVKTREAKLKENIDFAPNEQLPEVKADMAMTRPYVTNLSKSRNVVKIDTYLTSVEAAVKQKVSEEVVDSLRPDLTFLGKYNTSSYNVDHSTMQNNITNTARPVTYVGLSLSWLFGSDAKSAQFSAAKKEALASRLKADQARITGENAWLDLLRQYDLTKRNVLTLEKIAQLQRDRARAEQAKFTKGRTITSNVVNAETDAAQAEVNYLSAKSGLRKLEASSQLFMVIAE